MNIPSISIFLLVTLSANSQSWQSIQDFPGSERDDATSFVIGNDAYVGTGLTPWFAPTEDFYKLDMSTNTWSVAPALPLNAARQYACGFSSNGKGYVTTGSSGLIQLNDIREYDSFSQQWTELSPLPSYGRNGSACFVINDIAYLIGGKDSAGNILSEVWAYDIVNDIWVQKNNFPFGSRWRASATANLNSGFLIFGKDENGAFRNEMYRYEPVTDTWTFENTFPGPGMNYSSAIIFNNHIIIAGGIDTFNIAHDDVWSYDIQNSTWQQRSSLITGRKGGVLFNNATSIYYSTGINQSNTRLKETLHCSSPLSLTDLSEENNISIYPNPVTNHIVLNTPTAVVSFYITDITGRVVVPQMHITGFHNKISIQHLSDGCYILVVLDDNQNYNLHFIKTNH